MPCSCARDLLGAVHGYLAAGFPGVPRRDIHDRGRSPAGGPADVHLIRIGDETRPYSVVLSRPFLDGPAGDVATRLHRMDLLRALRTHRFVTVWPDAVYPLRPSGPEHG